MFKRLCVPNHVIKSLQKMIDDVLSQPAREIPNASRIKWLHVGQGLKFLRKDQKRRCPRLTPNGCLLQPFNQMKNFLFDFLQRNIENGL